MLDTLDLIEKRAAAYWASQNAPAAVAVRAIETLVSALADCSARECGEILDLLRDEIPDVAVCEFLAS